MKYVSVDLETTDLDAEKGQILELAMVIEDTERQSPVDELTSFSTPVDPGPIRGNAFALAMNARLLSTIARKDCWTTEQAQAAAITWLKEHMGDGVLTMAAKNGAGFDLVWLKRHMPMLAARFSYRVIDPGSVLIDWKTGPVSLGKLLGGEAKHEALADARDNIRALRKAYT